MVIILTWLFLFSSPAGANHIDAQNEGWEIKKSKHFIIYYQKPSAGYVGKVARRAEHYYRSITSYMGFMRFDFWTFENRCKIYLYPGREEYLKSPNVVPWSRAKTHIVKKEIATYLGQDEFFDYVLPHEMGHIIFREMVGFDKRLPLWLDEAIALLQEKNREKYLTVARELVKNGLYISLERLSGIKDYSLIIPLIFYSESASIVDFLLGEFGRRKFITFCRRLKDGEKWKRAILQTYKFEDLKELEQAWVRKVLDGR